MTTFVGALKGFELDQAMADGYTPGPWQDNVGGRMITNGWEFAYRQPTRCWSKASDPTKAIAYEAGDVYFHVFFNDDEIVPRVKAKKVEGVDIGEAVSNSAIGFLEFEQDGKPLPLQAYTLARAVILARRATLGDNWSHFSDSQVRRLVKDPFGRVVLAVNACLIPSP